MLQVSLLEALKATKESPRNQNKLPTSLQSLKQAINPLVDCRVVSIALPIPVSPASQLL